MTGIPFALLVPLVLTAGRGPDSLYGRVARFLRYGELKEVSAAPSWYPPGKVRFRFAQITDVHLNPQNELYLKKACRFLNAEIKPAFTVFTGDNSGSDRKERQRYFRDLVSRSLDCPFFVLPGDNWPRNFTSVFGSFQWSFDCGGIHFVGSGLDVDVEDFGIGRFLPDTWIWLKKELERNSRRPVVYFQHEPVQPPTFLDAGELDGLFESRSSVLLVMAGHLHVDLESRTGRVLHITAPALGPHRDHGFKVVEVYTDQLVIRTVRFRGGGYEFARKYQRVPIPKTLRGALSERPAAVRNLKKRPPRDTVFDSNLLLRQHELALEIAAYARKAGRFEILMRILAGGSPEKESRPKAGEDKKGGAKRPEAVRSK